MFFYEMLLAVALALVVFAILAPSGRYRGGDGVPLLLFFVPLLVLLIWAGGAWLTPIGPPVGGVYWLGFLLPAVFLLLLLFALSTPSGAPKREGDVVPENAEKEALAGTAVAFSLFFWILVVAAIAAVVAAYA